VERALIVTGDRGARKTTLCITLASSSPRFKGLVSPPLFSAGGNRVGFFAWCLSTREEWVFGRSDVELDGPRFGRFSFSSVGISRAVSCLRRAIARSPGPVMFAPAPAALKNAQGPVIVIDEIGSLELERGEGLASVLPLLADAGDLLLVVRPELVARVAELVPRHAREVVRVTPENREVLAAVVGRLLM